MFTVLGCGLGSYLNSTSEECITCPIGTYNPSRYDRDLCRNCRFGKTTEEEGTFYESSCSMSNMSDYSASKAKTGISLVFQEVSSYSYSTCRVKEAFSLARSRWIWGRIHVLRSGSEISEDVWNKHSHWLADYHWPITVLLLKCLWER